MSVEWSTAHWLMQVHTCTHTNAHLSFSVMLKSFFFCKWLVFTWEWHLKACIHDHFSQKFREHSWGLYLVFCLSCCYLQVVSAWTSLSTSCHSSLDVSCVVIPCIFRKSLHLSCQCILHPSFLWAFFILGGSQLLSGTLQSVWWMHLVHESTNMHSLFAVSW